MGSLCRRSRSEGRSTALACTRRDVQFSSDNVYNSEDLFIAGGEEQRLIGLENSEGTSRSPRWRRAGRCRPAAGWEPRPASPRCRSSRISGCGRRRLQHCKIQGRAPYDPMLDTAEEKESGGVKLNETYASRKRPASARHLTVVPRPPPAVVRGKKAWNSSQWSITARPPAEQPVSSTWSAEAIPTERRCRMTTSQMRWPRK